MKTVGPKAEQRNRGLLQHAETGGATYFLTFSAWPGESFSREERALILASCRFGYPARWLLHGAVVMPDHVHLLLTPQRIAPNAPQWFSLAEIVKSIKGVTARQINRLRGRSGGSIWQKDYYDRSIRDEADFQVKLNYMAQNPVRRGLVAETQEWDAIDLCGWSQQ
jgi:putative transposase